MLALTVAFFLAGTATGDAVADNDNLVLTQFAKLSGGTAAGQKNWAYDELFMLFAESA